MRKTAVCSATLPEEAREKLSSRVDGLILLPPHPTLPEPVASHADMLFCTVDKTVFFDKIYADTYPDVIKAVCDRGGLDPVIVMPLGKEYPADVHLNVLVADTFAVCRKDSASAEVLSRLAGRRIVNVKQGYAACSCLAYRDLVVTADCTITKALNGVCDTLIISSGGISLAPYDTGFIGGASGVDGDTVYFVGDIMNHTDGKRTVAALESRGANCVSLGERELFDVGGIKFLYN